MGRPIIVSKGWQGVLPTGAFRRYSFIEPVEVEPAPAPNDDDNELIVIEEV